MQAKSLSRFQRTFSSTKKKDISSKMKIQGSPIVLFVGLILYSALLRVVEGQSSPCPTLGSTRTAVFENAFSRPILGCNITQDQAMTATSRLHWLIPEGGEGILDLEDSDITGMLQDVGARPGQVGMVNQALTAGNASLAESGLLTVGAGCLMEIEPDLVAFLLATSEDVAEFNAAVGTECESRGVDMNASARDEVVLEVVVTTFVSICVYVTISVACGTTVTVVVVIQTIIQSIFRLVFCP